MSAPHLLHVFSTFAAGGPQVRTAALLNAFGAEFRHTIVAMDRNFECAERITGEVAVEYREPPALRPWSALPRLAGMIRSVAPDAVLTYNWGAIESIPAARLAGIPRLIHGEDGFGPEEAAGLKARRVWARRLLLKLVRHVVVPSRLLEGIALRRYRCGAPRTRYIPNGIDTEHFSPGSADALRREWGIPGDALVVGTVAKLRGEKGLELLIEAFARTREQHAAHLVLVGDGSERASLEAFAEQLGGERVHFAGTLPDPRDAYRAFDLFALSSHTEQMPISVVEAMGCGLAVLATDVGDVRQMVAAPNQGEVRAGRDPDAFGAALTGLLADATRREELGAANRERCLAEYRRETMLAAYRDLYTSVLEDALPTATARARA